MLVVGDLLSDPDAQSFISAVDADAYLAPEGHTAWSDASTSRREAALVVASRWLYAQMPWSRDALDETEVARVGQATARVALEALNRDIMAPHDPSQDVKRESVGQITVEYRDTKSGLVWPWLRPMLRGIITGGGGVSWVTRA